MTEVENATLVSNILMSGLTKLASIIV